MNRARSEHRKTKTPAISSGSPTRCSGVRATISSSIPSKVSNKGWVSAVRTMPGDTALTRMVGAYSRAAVAVSATTAALAAVGCLKSATR